MAGKGQVRAMEDEVFSLEEHAESALEQHDIRQHSLIREEEEAEDEAPDDWALAEIFHDALALLPALTPTVIRVTTTSFTSSVRISH